MAAVVASVASEVAGGEVDADAQADVPFLPMHQEMQEEPDWLTWMEPDGIHLNADGHRWLDQLLDQWAPLREWAGLAPVNTSTPISM